MEARAKSGELSPTYAREVKRWATPGKHGYIAALGARSIQSLQARAIRQWQRELRDLGLGGKTLWNVTAGLAAFLGWLVKEEALAVKPPIPWPRYDEHVPAIVVPAVQDRILEAIPVAERGIFLAMALLGMRHALDYRSLVF